MNSYLICFLISVHRRNLRARKKRRRRKIRKRTAMMTSKLEDIKSGFQNQRKKQKKHPPQINLFFYIVIQLSKVSNLYTFIKKFQNQYLTEESSISYENKKQFIYNPKRLHTAPELYYMYSLFWSPL